MDAGGVTPSDRTARWAAALTINAPMYPAAGAMRAFMAAIHIAAATITATTRRLTTTRRITGGRITRGRLRLLMAGVWGGSPWYGYYGAYFQPYPVYAAPSLWLTDYLIAASLQSAYEAGQASEGGMASVDELGKLAYGGGYEAAADTVSVGAKLTPELKQQIADEVKAEIAAEKAASATSTSSANSAAPATGADEKPSALDPGYKIFVVSSDLDVSTDDGQDCSLSIGDVIERVDADAGADNGVHVIVRAGKSTDCKVGSQPQVDLNDLQELHNHFREQVDAGLEELAKKAARTAYPRLRTRAKPEDPAPAPDPTAAAALQQQQKDADQAEAEAKQDAAAPQN